MKFESKKISRRKMLGGAAGTAASLPLVHALVPHQGVHDSVADAAETSHHSGHGGGKGGSQRQAGAVGRVDPRVNGFDPAELVRDFDRGTVVRERGRTVREFEIVAQDKEIEVAPGVKYAAWTYNGRVPGPTLRVTEGDRVRVRFVNGSRHPHTMHFHGIHVDTMDGVAGIGKGNVAAGRELHLRVRRRALRPAPLPLPHAAAGRPHRQGALRRVRDRSRRSRARRRTS